MYASCAWLHTRQRLALSKETSWSSRKYRSEWPATFRKRAAPLSASQLVVAKPYTGCSITNNYLSVHMGARETAATIRNWMVAAEAALGFPFKLCKAGWTAGSSAENESTCNHRRKASENYQDRLSQPDKPCIRQPIVI